MSVKTIKLIQQLQHSPLDFLLPSRVGVVSLCSNSVDLVDEDDCWGVLLSCLEQLPHQFRSVPQIFLDQLGPYNSEESS